MRLALFAAACLAGSLAAMPVSAALNLQPGLWEITATGQMADVPMRMPPQTARRCITKADVADPKRAIPADQNCTLEEVKQTGNLVNWRASCRTEMGAMKGVGKMTLSGHRFDGVLDMTTTVEGMAFGMKQTYSGKRLGDCK